MRTNTYYAKVGIWGETASTVYDFLEKTQLFKVFSKDQNQGIVNIQFSWQ
jgi:hypothetical protein